MDTPQPTLRLGRDVWDRTAMPIEEFQARADRLRAAMRERALDALLLYGVNLNGCGHPTWLANYIVKLPFAALVVLPRDGEAGLMFEGATRGRSAAQATTWIEDVRPCWNIGQTCVDVLTDRGLTGARLGLAGLPRLMPHTDWQTLVRGVPGATLVDAEDLVDRQRAVKSARELAQIHRASDIVAHALESVPQASSSAGEWRVAADVIRAARIAGAEDLRVLIAKPHSAEWAFRAIEDAAFADGETVAVLLAASWERYWAEAVRTFSVRGDRFEAMWKGRVDARFASLIRRLEPGTTTGAWARAALHSLTAREAHAIAPYGFGHSLGITPEEWPRLSLDGDTVVESGMCFAVRAAFEADAGFVLHGDTIIV